MKKIFLRTAALALCAVLLSGCSIPNLFGVSSFYYEDAEKYTMGGATLNGTIDKVEIEWINGSVLVTTHDDSTVAFEEQSDRKLSTDTTMYYWQEGATLHIKYGRSGRWNPSGLNKDLTLYLPEQLALAEMEIDVVSAGVILEGVSADQMTLETVSGGITADLPGAVAALEIDTVSGSANISAAQVATFVADSVSGAVSLSTTAAPETLKVETVSGGVDLYLPEQAGFTLRFDTVSGKLETALAGKSDGNQIVFGDGSGTYLVDTTSGNLTIMAN